MLQAGENLALGSEALQQHGTVGATPDRLDRHPLLVLRIVAHGLVDGAHAAACHRSRDPEWPQAAPDQRGRLGGHVTRKARGLESHGHVRRRVESSRAIVRRGQHAGELVAHSRRQCLIAQSAALLVPVRPFELEPGGLEQLPLARRELARVRGPGPPDGCRLRLGRHSGAFRIQRQGCVASLDTRNPVADSIMRRRRDVDAARRGPSPTHA